ncbi:MAG: hypothetical protein ACKOGH_01195, partial [Alphaproteobacteria bacterium]
PAADRAAMAGPATILRACAGAALTVHHVEANARTRAASAWVNPRSCYGQVLQQRGLPQATS